MIYCTDYACQFNVNLDEPIEFSFSKLITPLTNEKIMGKCRYGAVKLDAEIYDERDFKVDQPVCKQKGGFCGQLNCANNIKDGECDRKEILIGESLISHKFICQCFSNKKLSGHFDFSRLQNSDGTAHGGHLSDAEASRMDVDNRAAKSFPDHHRESKERVRRR